MAAARNAGLAAATGDLIALLDQDDLWEPRKLRLQIACLRERPEVGWVTCRTRWLLEPGTPMPPWVRPEWFEEPQVSFVTSAMLVRRETLESVGRFDESYVVGSDTDWMVRARDAGVDAVTLEEVLVYHRLHGANNSYDLEMTSEETLRLIKSSLTDGVARGHEPYLAMARQVVEVEEKVVPSGVERGVAASRDDHHRRRLAQQSRGQPRHEAAGGRLRGQRPAAAMPSRRAVQRQDHGTRH